MGKSFFRTVRNFSSTSYRAVVHLTRVFRILPVLCIYFRSHYNLRVEVRTRWAELAWVGGRGGGVVGGQR